MPPQALRRSLPLASSRQNHGGRARPRARLNSIPGAPSRACPLKAAGTQILRWTLNSNAQRPWAKGGSSCHPALLTSVQGTEMATNKKKVLLTESMAKSGRDLLAERGDIEIVGFANTIAAAEFQALLSAEAPVNAVALGGIRFGQKEIDAARDML